MTAILSTFAIALVASLLLTPVAIRIGKFLGAIDLPGERKIHVKPLPRSGGIAIVMAFFFALVFSRFLHNDVGRLLELNNETSALLGGALICFGLGLTDDVKRLGPKIKFLFQILAASIAFRGGVRVEYYHIFGLDAGYLVVDYVVTVFWFLLFINAVNLVDGLDGLAGGVSFFVSLVMVILSIIKGDLLTASLFAALGGAILGFLRYNFNPATIFLGDCGSYFIGYAIAGLSIVCFVKIQVGAVTLIPLLALGVPLFDTILSPLRRFVRGKRMFRPDNGHIHHRLIQMGLSARKTVLVIYSITLCLCLAAVILSNLRDDRAGLVLIVIGAGAFLFTKKLGYFEYLASDKLFGWFRDLSDEVGISRERRSFLSLQMDIHSSESYEELRENVGQALNYLEFDLAEIFVNSGDDEAGEAMREKYRWARNGFDVSIEASSNYLLKMELPLVAESRYHWGILWLVKDLRNGSISHYTLKRVEHLRRSIISALQKISYKKNGRPTRKAGGKLKAA